VVTELEIQAQSMSRGYKKGTFAAAGDIHVQPISAGNHER